MPTVEMERARYIQRVNANELVVDMTRNGRRFPIKANDKKTQDLVEGLLSEGRQLQPCMVSKLPDGGYRLDMGYRRWLAISYINENGLVEPGSPLSKLEVVVSKTPMTEQEAFCANVAENADRAEFTVMDRAYNAKVLKDEYGMTGKEVAARLHMKESRVSQILKLMTLPADIQKMLTDEMLNPSVAYELADAEEADRQAILDRIGRGELVSRETVRQVKAETRASKVDTVPTEGRGGGEKAKGEGASKPDKLDKAEGGEKAKPGPKPGLKFRTGKQILAELEEYADPEEGSTEEPYHKILRAVITYAMGKRGAPWLSGQVKEFAKSR